MKIIHISDLHYDGKSSKTRKLVDKIIGHYKNQSNKPLIINSGDLIENGGKKQLYGCKKHMKKLIDNGFEMLLCPGNHDIRKIKGAVKTSRGLKRFDSYYRELLPSHSNFMGEEDNNLTDFPITHKYENFFFIGLNSNKRKEPITPGGRLGSNQLRELDEIITEIHEEFEEAKIIIYLHHHPFEYNINIRNVIHFEQMQLIDRDDLHNIIKNRVETILFGHAHWDERLSDEEAKYGLKLAQLSADCTHDGSNITFNEIDLSSFSVDRI